MKLAILCLSVLFAAVPVSGQQGGKAEPMRIEFAAGRTTKTLAASLSNDEEMEFVFWAKKGQRVTIRNAKPGLFDVRVFRDDFNFETEFDSSPTLSFVLPETGDYNLFVRKKRVKTPKTAKFLVNLSIK